MFKGIRFKVMNVMDRDILKGGGGGHHISHSPVATLQFLLLYVE